MDRGGKRVKGLPEERVIQLAQYIIEQDATVRQAAGRFAISKSTVHKDAGVIIGIVKGSAEKP